MKPLGAALCALLALGCQTPFGAGGDGPDAETVATVDGESVSAEELDDFIKEDLFLQRTKGGNEARVYELRRDALPRLVQERVLERIAAERGLTVDELLDAELAAQDPITDEEITAFYQENREQIGDFPYAEVAPRIRRHLERERRAELAESLVAPAEVVISLRAPRVEVTGIGPALGPDDAPVTIVEFSDFQCPYCQRAIPVLSGLLERYPTQVRVVYRHFPLDRLHPRARAGAEASVCADEQGLFWEYHDLLFENGRALSDEDLRTYAATVGIESEAFEACLASGRAAGVVATDEAEARSIGATGTPTFVINGIVLYGLRPEAEFESLIAGELAGV